MKRQHGYRQNERGFTLIEILIVLAVLGILAAVVVPNLTGFLGRSKDRSYEVDKNTLQAAVNAYYTDTLARPGKRLYPTGNGSSGTASTNSYLNMNHLVSGNYLNSVPQSANTDNPGGTSGSYTWYVDGDGLVASAPTFTTNIYP